MSNDSNWGDGGAWKGDDLDREVEYAILHYPHNKNCTTRAEYSMALAIQALESENRRLTQLIENANQALLGKGQGVSSSDIRKTIEKLPDLPPRSSEIL